MDVSLTMMEMGLAIVARTLFGTTLGQEARELAAAINTIMGMYNYMIIMPAAETLVQVLDREGGSLAYGKLRNLTRKYRAPEVFGRVIQFGIDLGTWTVEGKTVALCVDE